MASDDPLESSTTQVTITIRDVNDSPPEFNRREFEVSLPENTPKDIPLALDMSVIDRDVGNNSKFSLRLEDVSKAFRVEPTFVNGYSQVNIRVANGSLDYENPNQRKFIVLVIAEETETQPKLTSTATITVAVLDVNDNLPIFEEEAYSASLPEDALPGHYITTITARDFDSGSFGDDGLRYSLTGNGAELFTVDERTGVVTLADCHQKKEQQTQQQQQQHRQLFKRQLPPEDNVAMMMHPQVNDTQQMMFENSVGTEANLEYELIRTTEYDEDQPNYNYKDSDDFGIMMTNYQKYTNEQYSLTCLDFETESTYFLNYKVK